MKTICLVPLLPSPTEASPTEIVGTTGGGSSPAPFSDRPVAVVPPVAPGLAWKPKVTLPPDGTSALYETFRRT